ncbi:MAG: hypothetical protein ABJZ55_16725 [Fuerstiella sp.]
MLSSQTLEPEVQEAAPSETCPRCHTTVEWGENSWCPDCGYYPIVDGNSTEGASWADKLPETPVEEFDNRSAMQSIPVWFWLMTGGIIGIALVSVGLRVWLTEQETLRGRVALGQLGIGMLSMAVAHAIAAKFAMSGDRRISIPDIFLSWFNIWQPTIGKLPHTCNRLLAMIWGMVACLTAVTVIGGIDYGYPFRGHEGVDLKPMNVVNAVASAARAQAEKNGQEGTSLEEAVQGDDLAMAAAGAGGDAMSMEDAIMQMSDMDEKLMNEMGGLDEMSADDLAGTGGAKSELEKRLEDIPKSEEGLREVTGILYGVETNNRKVPVALLFGTRSDEKWIHLTRVEQSGIPSRTFRRIVQKLNGKVVRGPFVDLETIPEPKSETRQAWVRPHVTCSLQFTEVENGELADVRVDSILINQPGSLSSL